MKMYTLFSVFSLLSAGCVGSEMDSQSPSNEASSAAVTQAQSGTNADDTASTLSIIKLKSKYSFAVDLVTKDPSKINQLTDLMTDDIVVDYGPSGIYTGKAAVANFFQNILPQAIAWGFHMPQNPVIEITGNRTATGDWYVHALGVYKSAYAAGPQPVYGRYHDTYSKSQGEWKFKTIQLIVDMPPTGP